MIAILVVATFLLAVVLDHLIHRQPIPVAAEESPRPRLVPHVVAGYTVPDNLRYHPGHTWAVQETPELVRIGVDDLAAKLAGTVTSIDIPERGQWIRQGQRIIAMHHGGRELDLVSPIEGTVVAINRKALDDPQLAQHDPYGDGWLIEVSSPDAATNFRNLLGGTLARRWMNDSATRLHGVKEIDEVPEAEWETLRKDLFLA